MSKETVIETRKSGMLYRTAEIDRARMTADSRTVELSFSSELPVERWDSYEILDHGPGSCDLSRLNNGAPLLMEHSRNDQVGVIEKAWIDSESKRGMANVRFGNSARANEIFQDVKDGIRRLVSVGYRISKMVTDKIENEVETLRAIAWLPMEISIVSVPADATVGIGRGDKTEFDIVIERSKLMGNEPNQPAAPSAPNPAPAPAPAPAGPNIIVTSADQREMLAMAERHNRIDLYRTALEKNWTRDEFNSNLLNGLNSRPIPIGGTVDAQRGLEESKQSLGDLFVNSEMYRTLKSQGKSKMSSQEFKTSFQRATLLSTGLTSYERPPGIILVEQQPLTIAQLFAQGQTTATTIRAFKETSYAQAATAVAEEGQKPEATFALEETDFAVKKIAVVGRVSDELIADYAAVRDYINQRLVFMVGSLEDNHLLNGTGSSNQIKGVLQTSGIQTEASGSSATIADAIHKAITKVRSTGFFEPDSIVMNPSDWQNLRLTKDGNGQYYSGGPFGGQYGVGGYTANGPLWGKPVVVTTAIAQGTALVGAFRMGAQLFRREGINVETTNSDASDFQYNRIAIRVEERLALAVYRPLAFCTVTGIPA